MDGLQWFVLSLVTLVLLAACSIFYYKYCHQPYKAFKDAGPSLQVCPNFKPFLGHSWDIAQQGVDNFNARIIKKYGNMTGLFLGALPTILVADPDLVQNLMMTNFNNFTDRPELLLSTSSAGLPVGIFNDKGDSWRNVRKLASTSFTGKKLRMLAPHVEKSCRVLVEKLKEVVSSSEEQKNSGMKSTNIFKFFGRFSIESSLLIVFGQLMDLQNGADPDFEKAVRNVGTTGRKGILSFLFNLPIQFMLMSQFPFLSSAIPFLSPSPLLRDFNTLCSKIQEMVRRRKAERMTSQSWNSKEADLLDQLINDAESRGEDPETIMEKRAVSHCFNFLMAGYETTALTLSYTCYLLALHPRVQDKLREEIRQFFASNKDASLVGVQELQYLDMVVQEVLRIYPPAQTFARSCTHATDLGGVRVPDGTCMLVPALLLHTDKKIWGDPDVFRPERFSAEEKAGRPNGCYMPFGLGPRNCIGMRFALMEMKMALSAILLELRFTPAPDTEIPLRTCSYTFITAPTNGVYLSISHLQHNYSNN